MEGTMQRTVLTEGSGRWFDASKAQAWEERTEWDGSNHISLATGSQWDHERLYRTAKGEWTVQCWPQLQEDRPRCNNG